MHNIGPTIIQCNTIVLADNGGYGDMLFHISAHTKIKTIKLTLIEHFSTDTLINFKSLCRTN